MSLQDRVLQLVRANPGLTDREITDRLLGRADGQQAVNQAARQLAADRRLARRRRADGLTGNYPSGSLDPDVARPAGVVAREPSGPRSKGTLARPKELGEADIERYVEAYLSKRDPGARYASFDFCFNYFQSYRESGQLSDLVRDSNIERSCLQLGFYLASWGMFRGKADLLQRSSRHLMPVVKAIAAAPRELWDTDADEYGDGRCPAIFAAADNIRAALGNKASDVLVTKIMLGTYGCVPAFDRYFKIGLRAATFGPKALRRIGKFHAAHAKAIERFRVPTLDYVSGGSTKRRYTRAKVIDMIFFIAGGAE